MADLDLAGLGSSFAGGLVFLSSAQPHEVFCSQITFKSHVYRDTTMSLFVYQIKQQQTNKKPVTKKQQVPGRALISLNRLPKRRL